MTERTFTASELLEAADALLRYAATLRGEVEQLQVKLAGCSVAALGNTRVAATQRATHGDYGYSASYHDVCDAVDREIALRDEVERLTQAHAAQGRELAILRERLNPSWNDLVLRLSETRSLLAESQSEVDSLRRDCANGDIELATLKAEIDGRGGHKELRGLLERKVAALEAELATLKARVEKAQVCLDRIGWDRSALQAAEQASAILRGDA